MEEMEILSKAELRQLIGATNGDGGCGSTKDTCKSNQICESGKNNGTCTWIENEHITECRCLNPYGGMTNMYGYYSHNG